MSYMFFYNPGSLFRSQAILDFCREIGITRSDGEAHLHLLEHHIRADLDAHSPRALAVLRPLRLVLTNLPADHFQEFPAKVQQHCKSLLWLGAGLWSCTVPHAHLAGLHAGVRAHAPWKCAVCRIPPAASSGLPNATLCSCLLLFVQPADCYACKY